MTPAVRALDSSGITYVVHTYDHDRSSPFGTEAAQKLGVAAERVLKTLVVTAADDTFAVTVIPVSTHLNLKLAAAALGAKRVAMAVPADAERITGYLVGGISPINQRRALTTLIDESALAFDTIFVSGGRRGLELELAPQDLSAVTGGSFAALTDR